jgi:hypothetical protein
METLSSTPTLSWWCRQTSSLRTRTRISNTSLRSMTLSSSRMSSLRASGSACFPSPSQGGWNSGSTRTEKLSTHGKVFHNVPRQILPHGQNQCPKRTNLQPPAEHHIIHSWGIEKVVGLHPSILTPWDWKLVCASIFLWWINNHVYGACNTLGVSLAFWHLHCMSLSIICSSMRMEHMWCTSETCETCVWNVLETSATSPWNICNIPLLVVFQCVYVFVLMPGNVNECWCHFFHVSHITLNSDP